MPEVIVGIDLGTTNSEISAYVDGKPQILGNGEQNMLPSCVGLSTTGELLIGQAARNQMLLYPERTVRSVKRLMGSGESVKLGDRAFSAQEISALILRELARWAGMRLGQPVKKAVVTVPAYFSDAQRNATREAGELAGLEVVRIINEPTAASLAYGLDKSSSGQTVMIYDLGGGTLDVSVVRIDGDVTEVLASHGNNRLGGDDFDLKLVDHLAGKFREQHGIDLRDRQPAAYARLWWAAETAKKQLSSEPYAKVVEESLLQIDGRQLHLDVEISRDEYEQMIRPLVDQTLDSVAKATADAGLTPQSMDAVLLVGGSTRTPLVMRRLEEICRQVPRHDLHPDLCVALGAGVLASRLGGHDVERVLVDVSPYSFGPSYLGIRDGETYSHCYHPIIQRNTPLPVTRTESYTTASDFQTGVEIDIYQGDDPDALRNVHVGHFRIEGLTPVEGPNIVMCRMRLDVDGILHVTAIEKRTGLSKHVAITGGGRERSASGSRGGREEIEELFARRRHDESEDDTEPLSSMPSMVDAEVVFSGDASGSDRTTDTGTDSSANDAASVALVERCRKLMPTLHADDQEEALNLIERVEDSLKANDAPAIAESQAALKEFLFFVEGR